MIEILSAEVRSSISRCSSRTRLSCDEIQLFHDMPACPCGKPQPHGAPREGPESAAQHFALVRAAYEKTTGNHWKKSDSEVCGHLARIDHRLSSRHILTERYNFSNNHAANATNFGVTDSALEHNGTERNSTHTGVVSLSSSFSSGILNEFRSHYTYESRPRINNLESGDFKSVAGPELGS